jgi:acyl-coenzyme A synthetase/AMP-(fatty) acid ligase
VLTQHNLVNLIRWHGDVLGAEPGDRVGQLASLAFDASVWEIWSALCLGACLCVADPALRSDPRALAGWIADEGLASCFLTTAVATRMFATGALAGAGRLRRLMVGGEKLAGVPPGLPCRLFNLYGPTESAVLATWFDLTGWQPGGPDAAGSPPIGRPVWNVRAYLLDRQLRPVPAGEVAELYLAGDGVAQGYLGQPGLTAERFLADRYGPAGARMYRTGDLASATADGVLEFHGRVDRQLKIHGVRVELDEIAHLLSRHEQVAEAAVVAVPGGSAAPVLVAYLAGAAGQSVDLAELHRWLRQRLPTAMLPARIGQLPALPQTLSGKTDLRSLAARPLPPGWPAPPRTPPGTATERAVAGHWADVLADVLGAEPVGVRENFFDVGGTSMTLLELRGHLEPRYGRPLPIALLFEHTTIAEQARLLDEHAGLHPVPEGDCQL